MYSNTGWRIASRVARHSPWMASTFSMWKKFRHILMLCVESLLCNGAFLVLRSGQALAYFLVQACQFIAQFMDFFHDFQADILKFVPKLVL